MKVRKMKTRVEILEKAASLEPVEAGSVDAEVHELLVEIAGENDETMLSMEDAEELLYVKDIYHFQAVAARRVRKFLAE